MTSELSFFLYDNGGGDMTHADAQKNGKYLYQCSDYTKTGQTKVFKGARFADGV